MTSTSDWPTNNQQTSSAALQYLCNSRASCRQKCCYVLCCRMNTSDSHPQGDFYGSLQKTWAEWTGSSTFVHHSLCQLATSTWQNIHYWWWRQCLVGYCSSCMLPVYHNATHHVISSLLHSLVTDIHLSYLLDASVHSNGHKKAAWRFIIHRAIQSFQNIVVICCDKKL